MNARLDMNEIKDKLAADIPTATAATSYHRDYLTKFAQLYPYVWVCAQRATRMDNGRKYSGQQRQTLKIDIAVRVIVKRYADGVLDNTTAFDSLCNQVVASLFGWQPTGANYPLVLEQMQDGAPEESLLNCDIIFSTEVTYTDG